LDTLHRLNPHSPDGFATDLRADLAAISAEIEPLQDQREEARLAAAHLLVRNSRDQDGRLEIEVRKIHREMSRLDATIAELRQRRRTVLQAMQAAEPVTVLPGLIDVAMPPRLVAVQEKLNAARAARAALMRYDNSEEGALTEKQRADEIARIEEDIRRLRQHRALELRPYDAAVRAALEPHLIKAGKDLRTAMQTALAAVAVLNQAAAFVPASAEDLRNRIGNLTPIVTALGDTLAAANALLGSLGAAGPEGR
jgi:hypothetical protein